MIPVPLVPANASFSISLSGRSRASKIGFVKYIRLEEMGTIGGATGADPREN
jgi:hypothetical protein